MALRLLRSAHIKAPTAVAFTRENLFLHDPERPRDDPNALLARMGGRMLDPAAINHNCPFCNQTMTWELFKAHAEPCMTRWFNTVDVTHRRFSGAALEETRG